MVQSRMGARAAPGGRSRRHRREVHRRGKPCRIFRTTIKGRPTAETCMGDASAIELPAADRATLAAAMAWSKELTDALAKVPMIRLSDNNPFRAGLVALRATTIAADGTRRTSEFTGVTTGALAADLFAVPAGYKEQKIDIPRSGRGGR